MQLLYSFVRAGSFTVAAADTVHAVWFLPDGDIEFAGLLAGAAFCAFFCVNFYAVK